MATDAPLLPHQCERLAQRAGLGIAAWAGPADTSGDLFIAFATGNRLPRSAERTERLDVDVRWPSWAVIDGLFDGVIEATEEAIVNALVAAETMVGRDGVTAQRCPTTGCSRSMARYGEDAAATRADGRPPKWGVRGTTQAPARGANRPSDDHSATAARLLDRHADQAAVLGPGAVVVADRS